MVLEIRGGGVIPLPYLIEKQRYNLTDEIIERLRHYKDFQELKKEIETEDANNDLVIEILEQNVSMINGSNEKVPKEKIRGKEPVKDTAGIVKPDKQGLNEADKTPKSSIQTPYIVLGDGQITIKVVTPKKRDEYMAKNHQINEAKAVISEDANSAAQGDEMIQHDQGQNNKNQTSTTDETKSAVTGIDLVSMQ